jgi:hypothetical protein
VLAAFKEFRTYTHFPLMGDMIYHQGNLWSYTNNESGLLSSLYHKKIKSQLHGEVL